MASHGSFVRFIVKVTGLTGLFECYFEDWLNMTVRTGDVDMTTAQVKVRVAIMIEKLLGPGIVAMTIITRGAIAAFVTIVFQVTRDAGNVHRVTERIVTVAIVACERRVLAGKREFGIPGMVKTRIMPVRWIVAVAAVISAPAVMRIVFGMTAKAGVRGVLVGFVFVAIEATGLKVFTDKWVARRIMIERGVGPFGCLMAIDALIA